MKKLSILIPLFNEENKILLTFQTVVNCMNNRDIDYELIVCDDASEDNSLAKVKNQKIIKVKILEHTVNQGFARTYKTCLEHANSEKIIFLTAGNDIDSDNLGMIIDKIDDADMVLQYCKNKKSRSILRYILSELYIKIMNKINGINLQYYNGFNILPLRNVKNIQINEDSFAFQSEIVSKLINSKGITYVEVGVECLYDDLNSTALNMKNVMQVLQYIFKRYFQSNWRKKWTE